MDRGQRKDLPRGTGIGVLPFLPLLASLGVDRWIAEALYPGTQELTRTQSVLSFLALKLAGDTRYSQDDLWAMDRGLPDGGVACAPERQHLEQLFLPDQPHHEPHLLEGDVCLA